jgi:hypothetical protein
MTGSRTHAAEARQTYVEHLGLASGISLELAKASLACAVHALLPGLCKRTASRSIANLERRLAAPAALGLTGNFLQDDRDPSNDHPLVGQAARREGLALPLLMSLALWFLIIEAIARLLR